jgi:hypothetical protein
MDDYLPFPRPHYYAKKKLPNINHRLHNYTKRMSSLSLLCRVQYRSCKGCRVTQLMKIKPVFSWNIRRTCENFTHEIKVWWWLWCENVCYGLVDVRTNLYPSPELYRTWTHSSTVKIEAARFSETFIPTCQTTLRHIAEDSNFFLQYMIFATECTYPMRSQCMILRWDILVVW